MKNIGECSGFDVTKDYLTNPTLRSKLSDSKQGWETFTITQLGWTTSPAWGTDLLEIWNCDFEISQTLTDLPNGKYKIHVQAFYRSGKPETAVLFGNDDKVSLTPLKKYTTSDFGSVTGNFTGEGLADNLTAASSVFNTYNPATGRNFYDDNELEVIVMDGTLKLGVKSTNSEGGAWCALRDFRLEYYGNFPGINLHGKIQKAEAFIDENYCQRGSQEFLNILSLCRQVGLKAYIFNYNSADRFYADTTEYAKYDEFDGFVMYDEPSAKQFDEIAALIPEFEKRYPNRVFYINLLPNYCLLFDNGKGQTETFGINSYEEYIANNGRKVIPLNFVDYDMLCVLGTFYYFHFPYNTDGTEYSEYTLFICT